MPDMEGACDVRRRNNNTIGLAGMTQGSMEVSTLAPCLVPACFDCLGIIGFVELRCGHLVLVSSFAIGKPCWRSSTSMNVTPQDNSLAGCSKRLFRKAAARKGLRRYIPTSCKPCALCHGFCRTERFLHCLRPPRSPSTRLKV